MMKLLMTPGQAAHAASFGSPLGGAMPADVWELHFTDEQRDGWEQIASRAIWAFNHPQGKSPAEAVFDSGFSRPSGKAWGDMPTGYVAHYERIAQAAIGCIRRGPALSPIEQRRSVMNAEAMTWVRVYGAMVLRDSMRVDPHDALRTLIERDADVQQLEKHGP